MTHRIEVLHKDDIVHFEFHGLMDAAALASLDAALELVRASGAQARVVLRSGTEVDRSILPVLRTLNVTLEAESPYLARWLAREP